MRKNYRRLKLIEISDVQALEDLKDLFDKDYNKNISYLTDKNISLKDKVLMNKWRKRDDNFTINYFKINGRDIKYLKANAFIEIALPEAKAIIEGTILPRANRVKQFEFEVIFFENYEKVYCVIMCPQSMDSKIKSALMGAGRSKAELAEAWGKLNDVNIDNYVLNSNLFYWLIKKDSRELELDGESLTINSIKALANSSLRGDTNYLSEGEDLLNKVVVKTTLGVEAQVDSVAITIEQEDGTFDIMLDVNGTCGVDEVSSILIREGGQPELIDDYLDEVIIRIYCCIIPLFKNLHKAECENGVWTEDTLQIYKRQLALEVINDLCYDNEITKDEVLKLDAFKEK